MDRIFQYTVQSSDLPCTVGEYLKRKGYSRQIIIHLKKTKNGILVNHTWAYVKTILQPGDLLTITLTEESSSEHIIPLPMPLCIVYEDEDILVLDKPSDTPVHPSVNNYDNTLANGVADYYQRQGQDFTFRCINRLDRDTTGLLILAKNALSASILSAQMKRREIHRTYLAVVSGTPSPSSGTITAPIARKEGSAIERCVDFARGEHAVTHYQVIKTEGSISLVQLSLETGRTHQIRVHMNYLHHPLLGDYLYHPDYSLIKRVSLHSCSLRFAHPVTGVPLEFHAPLPKDMAGLFSC